MTTLKAQGAFQKNITHGPRRCQPIVPERADQASQASTFNQITMLYALIRFSVGGDGGDGGHDVPLRTVSLLQLPLRICEGILRLLLRNTRQRRLLRNTRQRRLQPAEDIHAGAAHLELLHAVVELLLHLGACKLSYQAASERRQPANEGVFAIRQHPAQGFAWLPAQASTCVSHDGIRQLQLLQSALARSGVHRHRLTSAAWEGSGCHGRPHPCAHAAENQSFHIAHPYLANVF
jgi:hypothetical protein